MTINYKVRRDFRFKPDDKKSCLGNENLNKPEETLEYKEGFDDCIAGIIKENPYSDKNTYKKISYCLGFNAAIQEIFCDRTFDCD